MANNPQTFCVHHGMSPQLHTLEDVDALARFVRTGLISGVMITVLTRRSTRNELVEDEEPLCGLLLNGYMPGYLWGPGPNTAVCRGG